MGARGELFTTQIMLDNRSYFFNVKENRTGDIFLQIVESKNKNGESFDRHQIAVFSEDMQQFCKGFETALSYIEKKRKEKAKIATEKKLAKKAVYHVGGGKERSAKGRGENAQSEKPRKNADIKKTGRIHVVSKRNTESSEND